MVKAPTLCSDKACTPHPTPPNRMTSSPKSTYNHPTPVPVLVLNRKLEPCTPPQTPVAQPKARFQCLLFLEAHLSGLPPAHFSLWPSPSANGRRISVSDSISFRAPQGNKMECF